MQGRPKEPPKVSNLSSKSTLIDRLESRDLNDARREPPSANDPPIHNNSGPNQTPTSIDPLGESWINRPLPVPEHIGVESGQQSQPILDLRPVNRGNLASLAEGNPSPAGEILSRGRTESLEVPLPQLHKWIRGSEPIWDPLVEQHI
jgi:hypothetical protein